MRLRSSPVMMLALVVMSACDAKARRRSEGEETYWRNMAELQRQEDSAIEARRATLRRELPRREAQWAAHRIGAYRLAVRVSCFCPAPPLAVVTVRGDSTTVRNALGQPLSERETRWLAFSVNKLFDEVRKTVADTGWSIHARFDSTYGFPNSISTDHRRITDAGYSAMVEAFEILPPGSPPSRLRQN